MTTPLTNRLVPVALLLALTPACDITPEVDGGDTDAAETESGPSEGDSSGGDSSGAMGDCVVLSTEDFEGNAVFPAGCYLVDMLMFKTDGSVTFEPGAEVAFAANAGLSLIGEVAITAEGTAEDPVVFSGQTTGRGSWVGLSISSRSPDNRLSNVLLTDAGASDAALTLSNASIELDDVTIQGNAGFALLADATTDLSLANSVITDNDALMQIGIESVEFVDDTNALTGNDEDILHADGSTIDDAVWTVSEVVISPSANIDVDGAWMLFEGVTVAMRQGATITVRDTATITAEGTADAPVTLTGRVAERGYWGGLTVQSTSADNVLSNVRLEYGGGAPWTGGADSSGLVFLDAGGKLTIQDSTLANSDSAALRARAGADIEGFTGNTIEANAETLALQVDLVGDVDPSNSFVDNDEDFIRVQRINSPEASLTTPQTWQALEIPYRITFRVSIEAPLTLAPGVIVEFAQGEWIDVIEDGTLTAEGTANAPIVFEGGEALPGYWKGLHFGTISASNRLQNVTVRNAGESAWTGANESVGAIFVGWEDGLLEIVDSTLSDNDGNGVFVMDGSSVTCSNVTIDVQAPWLPSDGAGSSNCM